MMREIDELYDKTQEALKDKARLDWLLTNGFAIIPEDGAGSFAQKIFDDRAELDTYIQEISKQ